MKQSSAVWKKPLAKEMRLTHFTLGRDHSSGKGREQMAWSPLFVHFSLPILSA